MTKRTAKTICLFIACFMSSVLAFYFQNKASQMYTSVSLRYASPLAQNLVKNALEYTASAKSNLQISFWSETKGEASVNGKTCTAAFIRYLNRAEDCFYADFKSGTYAGYGDADGIAVSSELAWQLYKSENILGQNVVIDMKSYHICGIFKSDRAIALFQAEKNMTFQCAELSGTSNGDAKSQTEGFLKASLLPYPDNVVYGKSIANALLVLCFIPVFITACKVFISMKYFFGKLPKPYRELLFWITALCLVLLLPLLLNSLPAWLLPSRWSDFSHWHRIAKQTIEHIWNYAALTMFTKDALASTYCLLVCFFALVDTAAVHIVSGHNEYSDTTQPPSSAKSCCTDTP